MGGQHVGEQAQVQAIVLDNQDAFRHPSPSLATSFHRSYAIAAAPSSQSGSDHATLALSALTWLLSDEARAGRFLDLTGLDPADLRQRAGSREVAVATLRFLTAHEPDLVACARALDVPPARLVAVGEEFER